MTLVFVLCVVQLAVVVVADDPPGHMQPIGSHMPPMPIEERDDLPNPIEFYDNYVKPGIPVVFKGAAKKFPSYYNWTNDTYLREMYGAWDIVAEMGKKENRDFPVQKMNFSSFLSIYEKEDLYMVHNMARPHPITGDVFLPKSLLCRDFLESLNLIMMWFSSGGTKSVLHNDFVENINCLFDGTKRFVLIDRKHKDLVPIDNPDRGFSSVDVEKVDMHKYPTLGKLTWYIANMDTGDCFYIPYGWFHHVSSSRTRNLAINIWWRSFNQFDYKEECEKNLADIPEYDTLFNHPVKSGVKIHQLVFRDAYTDSKPNATYIEVATAVHPLFNKDETKENKRVYFKKLKYFFFNADTNKDKYLTKEEIESVDLETIKDFLTEDAVKQMEKKYTKVNDEL
uniref:jmjC domain-containing protein 5-like n=1 Tax=Ciona intestinalis TaxID=7719 RepID=UPI0005219983|nr:jmjC domain-containing protein 5-like [Ciona intestinalis]|eukprot:XP_026689484.1 jmjC domain-containing protein 5-like [Ciona intestinalis]